MSDLSLIVGSERIHETPIITSLGCPFDCTFCTVTMMFGRKYRMRSPESVIAELEAKKKIAFVAPSREEILALRLAIPELTPATIPVGVYPSLKEGYVSVGLYNFAVANKDLPDDLVYAIVDAVFANHQAARNIVPPQIKYV